MMIEISLEQYNNMEERLTELEYELAESVKVVRCGECKHLHPSGRCEEFADDGIRPSATDYCSYGERKGGDDE